MRWSIFGALAPHTHAPTNSWVSWWGRRFHKTLVVRRGSLSFTKWKHQHHHHQHHQAAAAADPLVGRFMLLLWQDSRSFGAWWMSVVASDIGINFAQTCTPQRVALACCVLPRRRLAESTENRKTNNPSPDTENPDTRGHTTALWRGIARAASRSIFFILYKKLNFTTSSVWPLHTTHKHPLSGHMLAELGNNC